MSLESTTKNTLLLGDCLIQMKTLEANSVDAVVTDPPYGLSFMGKKWDYDVPSVDVWREVFRVLKPGGHVLSFGGTRTYHRMVVNIEDAGFEIRDQCQWNFGSGFPKSHNVYKSALKAGLCCACDVQIKSENLSDLPSEMDTENALSNDAKSDLLIEVCEQVNFNQSNGQGAESNENNHNRMCGLSEKGDEAELLAQADKETRMQLSMQRSAARPGMEGSCAQGPSGVEQRDHKALSQEHKGTGQSVLAGRGDLQKIEGKLYRTEICPVLSSVYEDESQRRLHNGAPTNNGDATGPDAKPQRSSAPQGSQHEKQQPGKPRAMAVQSVAQNGRANLPECPKCKKQIIDSGLGSALKPANEPICLARKPLEKGLTLAENVLKYGTGAINIDGTRIGTETRTNSGMSSLGVMHDDNWVAKDNVSSTVQGRWPANVLFDEDAAEMLDAQSGHLIGCGNKKTGQADDGECSTFGIGGRNGPTKIYDRGGGASRFFKVIKQEEPCRFLYQAKASKRERNAGLDCSFLVWENDAWEKQDLKSALTAMLELAKDTSADILADDSSWSTDIYGHSISEQYPKGTIFTISMVLKTITELKTLSASQSLNTRESIQDAIKTIEASGLNLAESVSFINQLELNTISEKTAYLLGAVRAALPMLLQIKGFAKTNNFHSTVKPIKLMEYLITLITPPNGTVFDPFMGSGSTGVAAKNLERKFIGIEMDEQYFEIAKKRIEAAL